MFPQIAPKFLENRNNPDAFEPAPKGADEDTFTVTVDGNEYVVKVDDGGDVPMRAMGGRGFEPRKRRGSFSENSFLPMLLHF